MNNFFAILKDSIREAISGWVLQALLVISALFMIFVLGLSFRPLSPGEVLTKKVNLLSFLLRGDKNMPATDFAIENFTQTNASEPYWKGDYKFEMVAKTANPDDLKKLPPEMPVNESSMREFVRQTIPYLKDVQTKEVPGTPPGEIRVEFRSSGTTVTDPQAWICEPQIFFAIPTGQIFWMSQRQAIYRVEKTMVNDFGAWMAMLITVVVTAGFIPNLLRKGALDLYIAKPIGRVPLLLYKYVGGLTFAFVLAAFTIGGTWMIIGLRTGVWVPDFLLMIPIMTFYFAILYAISTFIAVLTRSMLVAILVTVLVWGLVFGVGLGHETVDEINKASQKELMKIKKAQGQEGVNPDELKAVQPVPSWVENLLLGLRKAVLPRTYDIDKLSGRLIAKGVLTPAEYKDKKFDEELPTNWPEVILISLFQIGVLLGLSSWRLVTRDG